ncbi:unnamed protein product [Linum tenue]|uniref:Uncharacterized protein n=1 Tax=Linum tenue TaxID=586396 RepID=A0AAV0MPH7_9ROSI|nr:unnamed protein product [Linum tenue]
MQPNIGIGLIIHVQTNGISSPLQDKNTNGISGSPQTSLLTLFSPAQTIQYKEETSCSYAYTLKFLTWTTLNLLSISWRDLPVNLQSLLRWTSYNHLKPEVLKSEMRVLLEYCGQEANCDSHIYPFNDVF